MVARHTETIDPRPLRLAARLDRNSPEYLWSQVASVLTHALLTGDLSPAACQRPTAELATRLGITRSTLKRALAHVDLSGFIGLVHSSDSTCL